jgi:UDP-glucose 4-epimerase
MKILVTGSSGFIGTAVRTSLSASGHTPVPYDLPEQDIRDADSLSRWVREFEVEAIINLAGMLGTPELFGHEAKAAETNVIGAINVYEAGAKAGIPVVQIGTGHKGQPNPYAITKACAEELGLARAQWRGEEIAIVRAYHVYGPRQPVGPPHGTASVHKFFPTFATRSLTGMDLELCGGGDQIIDPVYVDEVADALVTAAIHGPYGEVIEAGTGLAVSVRDIAKDILAACPESASRITEVEGRDGEPPSAVVLAERPACSNLWPYKVQETVDWYRQWLTR